MMSTSDRRQADLARIRQEYGRAVLLEPDLAGDWHTQFGQWLSDALTAELPEPNAMVLATADTRGRPSARTVLLKGFDQRGFTLFTNYMSRKGLDAAENPYGSLVFAWLPLHRQVVVHGAIEKVPRDETEAYFAVRPKPAQLGAWASAQSSVLPDRAALDDAYAEAERRFPGEVPAPPHWGGLRVVPESVEFWQGRPSRLHDRLRYRKAGDAWIIERLSP
jgi:pyridoxamine 5'-phosphate oxidase